MTPIIEAHRVTKRFGNVDALAGLDLVAESGQATALLGPNGAGKTTFVSHRIGASQRRNPLRCVRPRPLRSSQSGG
jgi:ABC-type multidrug transport system ATPase subunit